MALALEHAWRALTTRLCIRAPARRAANRDTTRAPWEWEDDESPDALSPVPAGSRSSMEVCAICLGGMRPGHGQALFTAECSHKFHFHCISSNVQHGNCVCPICRAVWTELHLPAKVSSTKSLDWPQDCSRLSRLNQRDQLPVFNAPDSSILYDYKCTNLRSKTNSGRRDVAAGTSNVQIMSFAEFPAIQQSVTEERFDILIHLKAPRLPVKLASSRGAAIDLVAVLDVSGSMAGAKLALLTRTMSFVIESLGPIDRLSVIAFQYSAWSLFPFRKMTAAGRWYSLQAIALLRAGGGSNVAEALRKAARVMEDRQARNAACSILLLSDGLGSREATTWQYARPSPDYSAFVPRSIRPGSGHHVRIHAFGFGADHNLAALRSVAEMSGGTFSFVDTVGSIPDAFDRCIGGLRSVVAQEARLSVQCAEQGVLLTSVHSGGYACTVDSDKRGGFVDVGDLYAGEERDILFTVHVPATRGEDTALLVPSCTYWAPVTMETVRVECVDVVVHRPPHPVSSSPMSVEVERERHRIHAMEGMATARDAAELGDFVLATSILEGCRVELESRASLSVDARTLALVAELREMQDRLETRRRYEWSGRAYILAALSAHLWQCATARGGDSAELDGLTHTYQMPCMLEMMQRTRLLLPEDVEEMNRSPAIAPSRALASPPVGQDEAIVLRDSDL